MITLWKYNKVTGYWIVCRQCEEDTAQSWLTIFKQDEPGSMFVLSRRKPSQPPK